VKTLRKNGIPRSALLDIRREVDVHQSLDHPLVVKLEDVYESSDSVHLVLEHLEGGELYDLISQRGEIGEAEAVGLVRQLLEAVSYLHSNGVIHGDLKPANVVFERKGGNVLKLIDFSAARRLDQKQPISGLQGTLTYLTPEAHLGCCTDKADLWSIGVITFAMLCGRSPWRSSDNAQIKRDIMAGEIFLYPPKWGPLSAEAKKFIKLLLQVNPRRRPSAAEALEHPWLQAPLCADTEIKQPQVRDLGVSQGEREETVVCECSGTRSFACKCCARLQWRTGSYLRVKQPLCESVAHAAVGDEKV